MYIITVNLISISEVRNMSYAFYMSALTKKLYQWSGGVINPAVIKTWVPPVSSVWVVFSTLYSVGEEVNKELELSDNTTKHEPSLPLRPWL